MPVTDINAAENLTNPVLSKSDSSRNKLAKDLDSFLTLLTSQLKNQDPLSPMDSTEFTNQLVSFAQVEQQINANENLTSLIDLTQQSITTNATNYIGKTIEALSKSFPLQQGYGKLAYGLADDAANATLLIRNEAGDIVFSAVADKSKGVHAFEWDGKDIYGVQQPDGIYSAEVTALNGKNEPIDTWTTAFGKVTGVTNANDRIMLVVDTLGIPLTEVLSVSSS